MVTISLDDAVLSRDVAAFADALARYERETRRDMKSALRSATIDLLRSLRARTRKSKRFVDKLEINKSDKPPKWIARGNAGKPLRRMAIARYAKGELYFDHRYVYGGELVRRRCRTVIRKYPIPHLRREAQRNYGQIRNWGLAKKSWGWFMHSLFRKATQDENPNLRIDRRMVEREIRESPNALSIRIHNKLEYIREAMPLGILSVALQKATKAINKKIDSGLKSRRFVS